MVIGILFLAKPLNLTYKNATISLKFLIADTGDLPEIRQITWLARCHQFQACIVKDQIRRLVLGVCQGFPYYPQLIEQTIVGCLRFDLYGLFDSPGFYKVYFLIFYATF